MALQDDNIWKCDNVIGWLNVICWCRAVNFRVFVPIDYDEFVHDPDSMYGRYACIITCLEHERRSHCLQRMNMPINCDTQEHINTG